MEQKAAGEMRDVIFPWLGYSNKDNLKTIEIYHEDGLSTNARKY